jgi:hypothetical protein
MTFENTTNGHDCNCLNKTSIVDNTDIFLRRLRKNALEEKDFLTHWERGIGHESELCEAICDYKAISINKSADEIEPLIFEHYKTTFQINPKKGGFCIKFKFKEDAGRLIHAPFENAESHYNFYKADLFTISHIDQIDIIKFA